MNISNGSIQAIALTQLFGIGGFTKFFISLQVILTVVILVLLHQLMKVVHNFQCNINALIIFTILRQLQVILEENNC